MTWDLHDLYQTFCSCEVIHPPLFHIVKSGDDNKNKKKAEQINQTGLSGITSDEVFLQNELWSAGHGVISNTFPRNR